MDHLYVCPKCKKQYNSSELRKPKCPTCRKWLEYVTPMEATPVSQDSTTGSTKSSKISDLEITLADLVSAQNRTTHAVRSLALFFFISLQTSMFGGGLVLMVMSSKSNYDYYGQLNAGAGFLVFLGYLIAFVGFLIAVIVGRRELDKSKTKS